MSGGSYDYLYEQPISELGNGTYLEHLDAMGEALFGAGAYQAAHKTRELAAALRCEDADPGLREVWHAVAVEWAQSNDWWGWDQVAKVLLRYEAAAATKERRGDGSL